MQAWIKRQMQSAFVLSLGLAAALVAITAASDEGGVAWSTRLARLVPLLPVPAACAYALTLWRAAKRGETRALESVGIEPFSWQRWALLAALLPALGGVIALGLGLDPSGLFPAASAAKPCLVLADGAFSCVQAGLRVQGSSLALLDAVAAAPADGPRGLSAALTVLLTGLAVVYWAGAALTRPLAGLLALGLGLGEMVICQAVGAGAFPAKAAVVLPALVVALSIAEQTTKARMGRMRA